ncbi:MAG: hypothetical protein ACK5LP_02290 [Campylobacteraceae bacterium]
MKKYLIGGAVRDKIMKRKNNDLDFVVVGLSSQDMLNLGFKSVGKSFPVFIHEDLEGEFALARTERKVGNKHFDFECFTQNVTLEDDLKRRDFTINAIAYDTEADKFIDPFCGINDIKNKILKPVSNAFCEDALRILRAARFKTQFGSEWSFDKTLYMYAKEIKDELKYISKERIYKETKKAMQCANPSIFFKSLLELDVLDVVFPWLFNLTKIEHNNVYHQEGSVFNHIMLGLDLCDGDEDAAWCVLFHDVGKYESYEKYGSFYRHYDDFIVKNSFKEIEKTLSLTKDEIKISKFFALNHHNFHKIFENLLKPSTIAKLLYKVKDEKTLKSLLIATYADMFGRIGQKHEVVLTKEQIIEIYRLLKIQNYEVNHETMNAEQIISIITHTQTNIIKDYLKNSLHVKGEK